MSPLKNRQVHLIPHCPMKMSESILVSFVSALWTVGICLLSGHDTVIVYYTLLHQVSLFSIFSPFIYCLCLKNMITFYLLGYICVFLSILHVCIKCSYIYMCLSCLFFNLFSVSTLTPLRGHTSVSWQTKPYIHQLYEHWIPSGGPNKSDGW